MFDSLIGGLLLLFHWTSLLYLLIGCFIGFWVGILPGIGGPTTLALMLPFIYKMTPQEAIPFLLGMHSVLSTTGDITSVLFGIPGEPSSVALIIDGYPMTKKGEAGRALGAILMSSLVGALAGAGFLAIAIPVVRPIVLALGSAEMFMVTVVGLTCISSLSSQGMRGLLMGLMCAGAGMLCSMIGQDPKYGILRYTFHLLYLWNGLPLVPVVVGFFAIPEIVDLWVRGTSIAGALHFEKLGKGAIEGVKDTFTHFWLTLRCSLIGCGLGLFPGLGGGIAQWAAYAHATQSAKTAEERAGFGKGDIRGVLGPGAANNSREGGSLVPTVAFGVPTGPSMAILAGGLYLMGIIPGPDMLTKHLSLTYSMVWTMALSNIIVVAVSLLFINQLARLTVIRAHLIIPFILLLCFIGGYSANGDIGDLVVVLLSGCVGYLMVRFRWPRPPFILGLILGDLSETYFHITISLYGAAFLLRPGVIILLCLGILVAFYPLIQTKIFKKKETVDEV